MAGRSTKALSKQQIEALQKFRRASHEGAPSGYSLSQLRSAMDLPVSYKTLGKALEGRPVWDLHYHRIVEWINTYLMHGAPAGDVRPPGVRQVSGKDAASGEREEEANGENGGPTARGSR